VTPLILTARMEENPADSHTLERYRSSGGYQTLRRVVESMTPAEVVEQVKVANLRGRGGAGFAAGVKWGFLARDTPHYLVVNCDEAEPGTFKDRQLLERDPHQLVEGIAIASYALGVGQAFVFVRGEYPRPARRLQRALDEAAAAGILGRGIFGSGFDLEVTVHLGAGAYICGEETALLNSLEGRRGEPRVRPPFPAVAGLYGKPTIVNNVETISNIPWILANGGAAYAAIGPEGSRGTRLVSISGHVERPGNYEAPMGMTWRELIYGLGGGVRGGRALKAWIPGGASAPWLFPEHLDQPVAFDDAARLGTMLGSGGVVVMDETTNVVAAAHSLVRFFAHESCGKCTPCREGSTWLLNVLERILGGKGRSSDLDLLVSIADGISVGLRWPPVMTTLCPLGPSVASPIISIMSHFRDEIEAMICQGAGAHG
jgi:NADH-quinone oxidoreductase subunit F